MFNKKFDIKPNQEIYVIPHGNARYRHNAAKPNTWPTPIAGKITKIGRVYFYALLENGTLTRFQLDDFSSCDNDENAMYQIFPTLDSCQDHIDREYCFKELRELCSKAIPKPDAYQHVPVNKLKDLINIMRTKEPEQK